MDIREISLLSSSIFLNRERGMRCQEEKGGKKSNATNLPFSFGDEVSRGERGAKKQRGQTPLLLWAGKRGEGEKSG